jgi:hypothetical protein
MPDTPEMVTIARGKTYPIRETLHSHGFTWDGDQKWWVKSPALDEADRFALTKEIRRLGFGGEVEVKNIRREWS